MNHGIYVWSAYGVMLLAMGGEVLVLVLQRRALRRRKQTERATHS
jgi:heme exporter protein CcmD